jgi:hypothetical protein
MQPARPEIGVTSLFARRGVSLQIVTQSASQEKPAGRAWQRDAP